MRGFRSPWLTSDLSETMRVPDVHHRKAIKTNYDFHWRQFKKFKISVNKIVKKCKSDYYADVIDRNKGNSEALWKSINEITSRKSDSSVNCTESDGVQYTSTESTTEVLNGYFASVGTTLATVCLTSIGHNLLVQEHNQNLQVFFSTC